jgi:hypothetical protein
MPHQINFLLGCIIAYQLRYKFRTWKLHRHLLGFVAELPPCVVILIQLIPQSLQCQFISVYAMLPKS